MLYGTQNDNVFHSGEVLISELYGTSSSNTNTNTNNKTHAFMESPEPGDSVIRTVLSSNKDQGPSNRRSNFKKTSERTPQPLLPTFETVIALFHKIGRTPHPQNREI